jgi:hypothetical protein
MTDRQLAASPYILLQAIFGVFGSRHIDGDIYEHHAHGLTVYVDYLLSTCRHRSDVTFVEAECRLICRAIFDNAEECVREAREMLWAGPTGLLRSVRE